MGTILTALAVAAALSQQGLARALRRLVPYVNRASGALLLLAGAYVVYSFAFFLLPGSDTRTSGRSLIDRGELLSSRVATWLSSGSGETAATILLAALGLLGVWAFACPFLRRGPTPRPEAVEREPVAGHGRPPREEGSQHEPAPSKA